jgi:tetratricopeptide (TPR) repeat protein
LKYMTICTLIVCIMTIGSPGMAETLEEYISRAEGYKNAGQYDEAIAAMEQAVKEYPGHTDAHGQLGIMLSEKAQRTSDFMKMSEILTRAFSAWDRALEIDPNNFTARFYRGAWAVNIPKFAGQLDKGINDLEILTQVLEKSPDPSSKERLAEAYQYLATGYQKNAEYGKAKNINEKIITLVPESEFAKSAQENIDKIVTFEEWQAEQRKLLPEDTPEIISLKKKVAKERGRFDLLFALGKAYYAIENYEEAASVLRKAVSIDQSSSEAYKLLAFSLGEISSVGYDPRIYLNTDFRTDLAFEATEALDKAVVLAPEDMELRLTRGITSVQMPFFVNRIDQGIADLEQVVESDVSRNMKAEATYWLGAAHQKKATTYWTQVVSKYSETEAAQDVFNNLRPPVEHVNLSKYIIPIVYIDFELSYRDELAPQTAVWIENAEGEFVKTIYVSGFSGNAKEKQVNLPVWAKSSEFADVDAVTGASINLGQHIYIWDLADYNGNRVNPGEYKVFVEVSYWPSMQYQRVEAPITIGKGATRKVIEEGDIIPYLEARYVPR